MKKTIIALVIAILLISSFPASVFAALPDNSAPVSDSSSQRILVKFKSGTSLSEAAQIHRQLSGQAKETISGIGVQVVTVPKGQAVKMAKAYSSNARVAYAEPDGIVEALAEPNDTYFAMQWSLQKVRAPEAWNVTTGSPNVTIAILDTGVDLDHPDLANKIISNINFSSSPTADDVYGHGTHVAGIAAAITNNGIGVAGLGYSTSIMNVKVLGDDGKGDCSGVAQGIIWAADNGAQIINLSLGGSDTSSTLEDAINYAWSKGVVVVAAAGNNGNSNPFYPAYYPNCIAVAATDINDVLAAWSDHGDWVDVAAPGVSVYSTMKNGAYCYMSGTSMASPYVAGLAALVFTTVSDTNGNGKLNDEVRSQIEATCDNISVSGIGYGRTNAARAVGNVPVLLGKISGQVTDAKDSSAIPGVRVSDGTRTALTDTAGKYTIDNAALGSYQVTASKDGYQSSSLTVNVLSGGTTVANFSLSQIVVPGSISGSITDAVDGSPISGAQVSDGTRTTVTDALGSYSIDNVPPGTYQVTPSKADYQSSSLAVSVLSGATSVANFSLSQILTPGRITGSVTDVKDGSPIVGATLSAGTRTVTTDASGKYAIANVPPGAYAVVASKDGYESSSLTVNVYSGGTTLTNFSLSQIFTPGSISGSVTDSKDGSPMAGATVSDGTRTATTDATGTYSIANVPPGTYQVTASKSGYQSSSLTVSVLAGATAVANLSLSQIILLGSITGSVTDAKDGSPIAGATVSDGTTTALTDGAGTYSINDVPAGSYQVVGSKVGYQSSSLTVTVLSGPTAIANLALSQIIVTGNITGSVTDAKDASPMVGATVSDGTRTATTDATGTYSIANVPPGTYQVTASKSGYQSSSLTLSVLAGATAIANLSLSQIIVPGSITGSVTDAKDGSPIAGAAVSDGTRTVLTDATGKYTISDIPAGSYQVVAGKEGYRSLTSTATVVSGGTAMLDFSLNQKEPAANAIWVDSIRFIKSGRDLYVEVRVVRANGVLSQAKVRLSLQCSNGKVWSFSGYTNTAGLVRFRLSRAPVGSYQATVTSLTRSGFIWDTSRGVTSSLFLSQIIVPDSITGSVTDAKGGSPMVGVTVSDGTRTALTDATGKYTINDVPSGSYQVVASKDGYESLASTATVVPGGTAMLDFSLNQRAPASKAMWADSIRFIKSGTDLYVEVRVVSDSSVLSRAKVRLSLQCSNGKVWSFSGNTKTAGLVRFRLSRAPAGSYLATVTNLTRSGFTWDTSRGITTSADYALSLSLSYSNWQIGPGIVLQYLWHL